MGVGSFENYKFSTVKPSNTYRVWGMQKQKVFAVTEICFINTENPSKSIIFECCQIPQKFKEFLGHESKL